MQCARVKGGSAWPASRLQARQAREVHNPQYWLVTRQCSAAALLQRAAFAPAPDVDRAVGADGSAVVVAALQRHDVGVDERPHGREAQAGHLVALAQLAKAAGAWGGWARFRATENPLDHQQPLGVRGQTLHADSWLTPGPGPGPTTPAANKGDAVWAPSAPAEHGTSLPSYITSASVCVAPHATWEVLKNALDS